MFESSDQVIAITGASSGIGRAVARLFAARGWKVGLIARGREGLEESRAEVEAAGSHAAVAPADVADADALDQAAGRIEAELGAIDVWVNAAGAGIVAPFDQTTPEEFHRVTAVTYLGTVNGTRSALQRMVPRDRGVVINVVAAVAYRGAPLLSAYSGAKWAIRGFADAVRSELIHDNSRVRITNVYPPSVNTPFYGHMPSRWAEDVPRPPPPVYQPELIAEAVYFALVSGRRDLLVGGRSVQVALMNALTPSLTDWLLGKLGYRAQRSRNTQAQRLRDPALFEPGQHPHQVHGPWPAKQRSVQLWAVKNPNQAALCAGLGVLALLAALPRRPRRPPPRRLAAR